MSVALKTSESRLQPGVFWSGGLPSDWRVKRLKFAVRLISVKVAYGESDLPYVGLEHIESWTGRYLEDEEASPDGIVNHFEPGDVLFGKLRPYLAKVHLAQHRGTCSTEALVLRPSEELLSEYLRYFLIAPVTIENINSSTYGSKMPRASWDFIGNQLQPLPPLKQQKKIATFLDRKTAEIDTLIAKKRRLLDLLAEKRTALITYAVTKGLNSDAPMKDSGIEWLWKIPAHWDVASFRWRCSVASGQVDPREPEYASLPLIAPDHIESNTGRLLEVTSAEEQGAISGKYFFPKGTLLYSKIRPNLSKVCIAPFDGLCSADMYPILTSKELKTKYLMYQLLANRFKSYAVMQSLRVAMPKLNREALGSAPIVVPPLEEQEDVISYVDGVWGEVDSISKKILAAVSKLEEYRSALITNAVTGQIKVA